jgi:NAD+ kinase
MHTRFKNIGIVGKPSDSRISTTLTNLLNFLQQYSLSIRIADNSAEFISDPAIQILPLEQLAEHCDLLIAVGGDGTFLAAARISASRGIPLIGINLGRVGFLVDISPEEMFIKLGDILAGYYHEERRYLLRTTIIRGDKIIQKEISLNEVVIHRWITPSMIKIVTYINGHFLNCQRSDGLIISTPTGSTAYALAAGGPILHPSLNALVLVPLNPHTLSNRPIVIDDSAEIEIKFAQTRQINALVTCDHLEIPEVFISDRILIKKDPTPIRILHPQGHDFFTLRQKLHWSNDSLIESA